MKTTLTLFCILGLGVALMYGFQNRKTARRSSKNTEPPARRHPQQSHLPNKDRRPRTRDLSDIPASASDVKLVDRVRSVMGHVTTRAGSIRVTSREGRVTLSGPILAAEVDRLIRTIATIHGVKHISNHLDVYETAGNIPGLQ